jgi:hypothetical protein
MSKSGPVSVEVGGEKYTGRYSLDNEGRLTVTYQNRSLSDPLSRLIKGDDPLPVARELLRRLVNEVHRGRHK